ncbi:hypothetical protein [Microcoleus sp. A006_D1]|uniref:hypothetical protein n=1 Tax=Microcoleus sp. A006_D1 TaxID=3055267 RepID=UPI002FD4C4C3
MTAEINIRLKKSGGFPQIYLYCAPVATAGISSLKVSWVRGISIGSSATDFLTDLTDVTDVS